jgi:hypothetical protein
MCGCSLLSVGCCGLPLIGIDVSLFHLHSLCNQLGGLLFDMVLHSRLYIMGLKLLLLLLRLLSLMQLLLLALKL